MKHFVQIAVLIFACIFSLWIFREHFEVDIAAKTKEIEQQIANMDTENEKLEGEAAQMKENIPGFQQSLKTSEDQLGPAKSNYESKMTEKKSGEVSDLDKKHGDCVQKMPTLVEEKNEADVKIAKIRPIIEALQAEVDKLKQQRDLLKMEEEKLKKEYLVLYNEDEELEKVAADFKMKLIKCMSR